jgi:apolipoprotein N-acyltransferase
VRKGDLFFLTLASSLLVSVSFPRFDLGMLAWLGLSPFLFGLRQRSLFEAATLGFFFGAFFWIGAFSWALKVISIYNFLFILVEFSVFSLVFGFLYRLINRSIGSWMIVGAPALWVSLEYIRSNLFFLAWPWNLLGHSQYRYLALVQIADITSVYGISFLIVMVNQFLSQLPDLLTRSKVVRSSNSTGYVYGRKTVLVHLLVVAILLIFTLSYGLQRLKGWGGDGHLRVGLVQANLLARNYMPLPDQVKHLRAYERLTREAAQKKPDLIVWPASSLPALISTPLVQTTLPQLTRETGSYLLVGGAGYEKLNPQKDRKQPYTNSEYLISPSGQLVDHYHKIKLLAFNEYIPLEGIIPWPEWITPLKESFLPGEKYTLFQVSGARFGTPICWENLFPNLFRRFVLEGADFMVCVTNEGFLGNTSAPYQSLAMDTFRAIENKVAIVRGATTGISAFINPDGEIVDRVRDGKGKDFSISGFLVRDVPLCKKKTLYTVYGDIFAYISIGIAVISILASLLKQKRKHS